jgi:hypothetical protein
MVKYINPIMSLSSLSEIKLEDLAITSGSTIATFYLIENFIKSAFPENYKEMLSVGLSAASAMTLLAPMISNIHKGISITDGITFDSALIKKMVIAGGISALIFYIIKRAFPTMMDTSVKRYVSAVLSVLSTQMILPKLQSLTANVVSASDE